MLGLPAPYRTPRQYALQPAPMAIVPCPLATALRTYLSNLLAAL